MQHTRVGDHERKRQRHIELDPVRGERRFEIVNRRGHCIGQINRLKPHGQGSRFDTGHLDQIVEQPRKPLCLGLERFCRHRSRLLMNDQISSSQHRRERCLEVMPQ